MRRFIQDDRGISGALDMTLAIGLIMFPIVILVASLPQWIEVRSMAELAAQEAARSVVLAADQTSGEAAGDAAARRIADNHGIDGSSISVTFTGTLDWGDEITATVTVPLPVLAVPLIGTFAATDYTAQHVERVDDYRSFTP